MLPHVGRGGSLVVLVAALVPAFALTSTATRLYHDRERSLAADWTTRGNVDLTAGRASDAVDDFRSALAFAHDDRDVRLRLAQALVAARRPAEARAQLLSLRAASPASGIVNLTLARLAVSAGDLPGATAYYHDALAGVWETDPEEQRRQTRLEFASMLLAHDDRTAAQAQLLALVAELPPGSDLHGRVANLLLDAGAPERALDSFRHILASRPRDRDALAGAGRAAFAAGDYADARRYLTQSARQGPLDAAARDALDTSSAVLDLDPFVRRLSSSERSQRAFLAFRHARTRLSDCAAASGVRLDDAASTDPLHDLATEADSLEHDINRPAFARDSDLLDAVMTLVFRIETTTASRCGAPEGANRALLLLARQQGAGER